MMEVMIVMAIIAIVTAIGLPNFISWRVSHKLTGSTFNLRGDLESARLKSIKDNQCVGVIFTANDYTLFSDNGASPCDGVMDADESAILVRELPVGVSVDLANTTFAGNATWFNGRGLPGNQGTVRLKSEAGNRDIAVNRVGRISTQ